MGKGQPWGRGGLGQNPDVQNYEEKADSYGK
jgi:hypothetical protein